jgi:integrase
MKNEGGSGRKSTRNAHGYSVYRRKDGRWVASVVVGYTAKGNPKRKAQYAPTQAEAVKLALAMVGAKDSNRLVTAKDQKLKDFMLNWLENVVKPDRAPKTYHFYRANIALHIVPTLGHTRLATLSAFDVQTLIHSLTRQGLKPTTVRGVKATLSAALNYAFRIDLIPSNVTEKVTLPQKRTEERIWLTPAMARELHAVAQTDPVGPLIAFGLMTGVRIGEALGLQWSDVDLDHGCLAVSKQLQRVDSKVVHRSLKSFASRRNIPLTGPIQSILAEQRRRFIELMQREPLPQEPIFTNTTGTAWDARNVNRRLKELCEKAGVPSISFHSLRHTAATLALAGGGDLHAVKGMLGHSQISLTADLYGHVQTESTRKAMDSLNSSLGIV